MTHPTETDTRLSPADLGLDYAVHVPGLDPFPWQLALADGRVVLLSTDLTRSALLPAGGDIYELSSPHTVPPSWIPPAVLTAARRVLVRADDWLTLLLARRRQIAQLWEVGDVVAVRPDLTDDQAWRVLREVDQTQDADTGITWRVLEDTAVALFGPAPADETAGD